MGCNPLPGKDPTEIWEHRKLGRPRGPGKSRLDPNREEIVALLRNGSTKTFIAKRYKTTPANLHNWIKKNGVILKVSSEVQIS
jgi:hypothetical protein